MSALASGSALASPDDIRTAFCAAMSDMYRREVPAYGSLMELVAAVNERTLTADTDIRERLTCRGVRRLPIPTAAEVFGVANTAPGEGFRDMRLAGRKYRMSGGLHSVPLVSMLRPNSTPRSA